MMGKSKVIDTPFGIRLPREFQCGAVIYTVVVQDEFDDEDRFGDCNRIKKIIRISLKQHQSAASLLVTFWHEVGHAIEFEYRIERDDDGNERQAQGTVQAVMALMAAQ